MYVYGVIDKNGSASGIIDTINLTDGSFTLVEKQSPLDSNKHSRFLLKLLTSYNTLESGAIEIKLDFINSNHSRAYILRKDGNYKNIASPEKVSGELIASSTEPDFYFYQADSNILYALNVNDMRSPPAKVALPSGLANNTLLGVSYTPNHKYLYLFIKDKGVTTIDTKNKTINDLAFGGPYKNSNLTNIMCNTFIGPSFSSLTPFQVTKTIERSSVTDKNTKIIQTAGANTKKSTKNMRIAVKNISFILKINSRIKKQTTAQ